MRHQAFVCPVQNGVLFILGLNYTMTLKRAINADGGTKDIFCQPQKLVVIIIRYLYSLDFVYCNESLSSIQTDEMLLSVT